MSDVPAEVDDNEALHRRVHPNFIKQDGSISSQAFTDPSMSVDRASYRSIPETMANNQGYGLAAITTILARSLNQRVEAAPELLNPAHALVMGTKSKSVQRQMARAAAWVIQLSAPVAP